MVLLVEAEPLDKANPYPEKVFIIVAKDSCLPDGRDLM